MGTKNNPGKFDCYHAADPDEPMFIMLARDPLAAFLTSIWSSMRYGDTEAAMVKFNKMITDLAPRYAVSPDCDKASEALECAMKMFAWRKENRPEPTDSTRG